MKTSGHEVDGGLPEIEVEDDFEGAGSVLLSPPDAFGPGDKEFGAELVAMGTHGSTVGSRRKKAVRKHCHIELCVKGSE